MFKHLIKTKKNKGQELEGSLKNIEKDITSTETLKENRRFMEDVNEKSKRVYCQYHK